MGEEGAKAGGSTVERRERKLVSPKTK